MPKSLPVSVARDRRAGNDRRARPTPFTAIFRWQGRRHTFRRQGEGANQHVDRPSRRTSALVVCIVTLSLLDAFFTLLHLEQGGKEINPLMALFLGLGVPMFLIAKTTLTDLGVIFLAIHENFRLGQRALNVAAVVYSILLSYHGVLILWKAG